MKKFLSFVGACLLVATLALGISTPASAQKACGLDVSRVEMHPVSADVPDNIRAFHGKWGEGWWDGSLCHVLFVRTVYANGTASVLYVYGAGRTFPAGSFSATGKIEGGTLSFTNGVGADIRYEIKGGKLRGTFRDHNGAYHITMTRDVSSASN